MRFPSGVTDQYIYFVAVDATDFTTRETGLSTFTVYRARNGAAAAAYTTPTIAEVSSANLPGVYSLLLDEDMTIGSGNDSEEVVLHITHAGMAPVTRVFELYRNVVTAGETLGVSSGALQSIANDAITAASIAANAIGSAEIADGAITAAKIATGAIDADALATDAVTEIQTGLATDTTALAIKAKTDNLPTDPADESLIIAATDAIMARLGAPAGASIAADIAAVTAPTGNENADALLDRVDGVESGFTVRQVLRLVGAVLGGKASGLDSNTAVYRDLGDTKNRIVSTVDSAGNRTDISRDLT